MNVLGHLMKPKWSPNISEENAKARRMECKYVNACSILARNMKCRKLFTSNVSSEQGALNVRLRVTAPRTRRVSQRLLQINGFTFTPGVSASLAHLRKDTLSAAAQTKQKTGESWSSSWTSQFSHFHIKLALTRTEKVKVCRCKLTVRDILRGQSQPLRQDICRLINVFQRRLIVKSAAEALLGVSTFGQLTVVDHYRCHEPPEKMRRHAVPLFKPQKKKTSSQCFYR